MSVDILDRDLTAGAAQPAAAPGPDGDVLGRIGHFETRLARSAREVDAAQSVRFRVFVDEMNAQLPSDAMRRRRDFDSYDSFCDHLLVLDRSIDGDSEDQIVGTYRLLRQDVAMANRGFYSASEFDLEPLISRHPETRFMELGRSCVLPQYRSKRILELLWQGNWAYALKYGMGAMFGCASFPGVDPQAHALALSFLHYNAAAKGEWAVDALPELACRMDLLPADAVNARQALAAMPPLVKGYLRLGATVGSTAVIDHAFNTTDVLIVLPISRISDRYLNYYGVDAGRFAS